MADFAAQLSRIKHKLAETRTKRISTFGAGTHGYELGSPISQADLEAFEAAHKVVLPDAYRAFVTQIGYGGSGKKDGAGPYYGLCTLDGWNDFISWANDDTPERWLARSCPLVPGRNVLPELDEDMPDDLWPGEAYLENFAGILTIGTRGCTYMTGLVVTGEARGRVVYLDVQYDEPPYVGRDSNFLDWYERWLDELLAGYDSGWFGYGPAGGEGQLLAILGSHAPDDLRREAVANLWKLPELTAATWTSLESAVGDAEPEVRAIAARIFERGQPAHARLLEPLLSDESPDVRAAACRSIAHLSPAYIDTLWSLLLAESDPEVQHAAYHALLREKALDDGRLRLLAAAEHLGSVRQQAQQALARK